MLVLYETSLGLCLFKLTDAGKLEKGSLWKEFQTPERAASLYVHSFDLAASDLPVNRSGSKKNAFGADVAPAV